MNHYDVRDFDSRERAARGADTPMSNQKTPGFPLSIVLGALLVTGMGPAAVAQTAQLKVCVVNVSQLLEEAPQAKAAMTALQSEFAPRQREIVNEQNELKAREDKLQRDSAVMSEAERNNTEKDLRDGQRELSRKQNEYVEDLNVRRNEELGRLQRILLQEVQTYAKAQGYDLVLGDSVLYARDSFNITPAVLSNLQSKAKLAPAPTAQPKTQEKKP
jgi:outer membrane protein